MINTLPETVHHIFPLGHGVQCPFMHLPVPTNRFTYIVFTEGHFFPVPIGCTYYHTRLRGLALEINPVQARQDYCICRKPGFEKGGNRTKLLEMKQIESQGLNQISWEGKVYC